MLRNPTCYLRNVLELDLALWIWAASTTGSGDPVKEFGFYPKMIKPQRDFLALEKS